jgi:hypothetical protein
LLQLKPHFTTTYLHSLGRKVIGIILLLAFSFSGIAQQSAVSVDSSGKSDNKSSGRIWFIGAAHVAFLAGTYIALNKDWYADYPRTSFHFFDDFHEWNQMDKCGHIWTAYQISRVSSATWSWAGMNKKTAVFLGSATGLAYQSIIEIQDGFSSAWGFSWSDMAANVIGASAYAAQELGWHDQRIQIKFSYSPYNYPPDQKERADQLFGTGPMERALKDYNSQTYWASVNLRSFFPHSKLPKWLNLSFGYGAEGMLGGFENKWTDKDGSTITRYDVERLRQFYFAPDIDLTKIKTKSKVLRSVFFVLNAIKIPAPTISWNSNGTCKVYVLYF